MECKLREKFAAVYFVAVDVLMHYFLNEFVTIGVNITLRHLFALLLAVSGFIYFLVFPNVSRGIVAVKAVFVVSIPTLVMLTSSLLIWYVGRTDFDLISRGLSYYFLFMNNVSAAFAAAAMLYVFGEKGIWYHLTAILTANLLMIVTVMARHGVGVYLNELATLIKTFAGETGPVIMEAEIHELAFCVGTFLIYMLLRFQRKPLYFLFLGLAGFCFLSAFKRIAVIGVGAGLLAGWGLLLLLKRANPKTISRIITITLLGIIALLIGYIGAVKFGVFQLMEEAGLDTSGRAAIFRGIDQFYTFSPTFLGQGMGFLTYQLNENLSLGVGAIHNDFLQFYIDLGFIGYILWLLSLTVLRTGYFGRGGKSGNQIIVFAVLLYMIIVSTTDNTMNYQLFNSAVAMAVMGPGFDQWVREDEYRRFGWVSPGNRPREGGSLL